LRRGISTASAAALLILLGTAAGTQEPRQAYVDGLRALQRRDAEGARRLLEEAIRQDPNPGRDAPLPGGRRGEYFPYAHLAQACLILGDAACVRDAVGQSEARGEPPAARLRLVAPMLRQRLGRQGLPGTQAEPSPGEAALSPAEAEELALAAQELARAAEGRPHAPAPAPPAVAHPVPPSLPAPRFVPAVPAAAVLEIFSDPPGADVYVDDEPVGRTDPVSGRLVKTGLPAGRHRVRVEAAGRQASGEVATQAAGTSTLRLALPPLSRSRPTRLAAVVALLVAAGVLAALVRRRRARRRAQAAAPTAASLPATTPRPGASSGPSTRAPTAGELETLETRARPTRVAESQAQFGPFRLLAQLGRGGMATVFKAERGGETIALKRPLGSFADDTEFLERFLREAEIGRTLHHPNIVRIFERGEVDGVPYFTMELVAGETLQERLKSRGALAPAEAARLVVQVAEALDYAHLKGVVHRDLKPSNIMVLKDGAVKVMDYGIARARRFDGITVTGAFLGTPDYVAPETAEGRGTDARSDLYSLGIVLYEALTGQRPFSADSAFVTLKKHCTEPPTPPSVIAPGVPRELEAIVLKLLRKDPAERYASAEELILALRDYLGRAA
jgi:hypothetical protein